MLNTLRQVVILIQEFLTLHSLRVQAKNLSWLQIASRQEMGCKLADRDVCRSQKIFKMICSHG